MQRHLENVSNLAALIQGGPNTRDPDPWTEGITQGQAVFLEEQYQRDLLLSGERIAGFLGNVGISLAQSINVGRPRQEVHDEAVARVQQRLGVA